MSSCEFLRACVYESIRMAPPVGSCLFREVLAKGILVDGHYIPEGCDVGTGIFSIHHNADIYPEPHTFWPERWLCDGIGQPTSAFNPFSVGPRSCVGKGLALSELMLTLAVALWTFDVRRAQGPAGDFGGGDITQADGRKNACEYQLYDHLTSAKRGPMLQFRRRA